MKTKFTWLGIVAACILGISTAFIGCENDVNAETITYKGRVVTPTGNRPISNVTVSITNGVTVRATTKTKEDGLFSLSVSIREIDKHFYLELSDGGGNVRKGELRAFGSSVYDYGDILFVDIIPVVKINELTDMTPTSFTCRCEVESQGGIKTMERGICWGTNIPTIEDNKEKYGSGDGEYVCTIKNDNFNFSTTTWYARAYAINEYGDKAYSEPIEINATKLAEFAALKLPVVETVELADMTEKSFTCKCNVKSQGGSVVTERGLCWSTNVPTIEDNKEVCGVGEGVYTCIVNRENLDFNTTTYYARAYAINEYGVAYGKTIDITPSKFAEFMKSKYPIVETVELVDMTEKSFTCRCNVKSQGGSVVTERGLCWSTNVPTIEDNKEVCGVGEGVYTCIVNRENLDFNTTTYYARAYAINEYGVAYGELIEINSAKLSVFTALRLPTVETVGLTAMTINSFTCKCNVKSQGKAIVTERGICWATNIPTIENNVEQSGSGEGIYFCTVTNLDFTNTTYYVRAYAINEYGVAYGEPVEVNSSRMAYFSLPTMEYGGYTYHIHPDLGGMQWQQGYDACENLVAYGFDDWFMPNKEEMLAIAEKTILFNNDYKYWTSTTGDNGTHYYIYYYNYITGGTSGYLYDWAKSSSIFHVIPVRKDR